MKEAEPERVLGPSGAAMVAQGATLVKAENETMSAIALMRPRDERAVLKDALGELDLVPEQAKSAYYSIPYVDRKTKKTHYVQGLSIDGATALARRWGNCSVGGRILNEDETGFDVEGIFYDLQTNYRMAKPHRASKYRKIGSHWVLADEQRLLMGIQASISKAQRNAIEAGLPPYLTGAYFEKARIATGGAPNVKADAKKIEAVVAAFERFKVSPEMLEQSVGRARDQWYGEDVANLRGLFKVLLDGGMQVSEVWPDTPGAPTETTGAVSVASLEASPLKSGDGGSHATDPEIMVEKVNTATGEITNGTNAPNGTGTETDAIAEARALFKS